MGNTFGPVLKYCSAVWCSAAETHLTLLDLAVSGVSFLTWNVLECKHQRLVAILCMLDKIIDATRCTLSMVLYFRSLYQLGLHNIYVVIPIVYVSHYYSYAPPRYRTSHYRGTLIPHQYLCGTTSMIMYSMVWDLLVSRAGPMFLYWPKMLARFLSSTVSPFSSFFLWVHQQSRAYM